MTYDFSLIPRYFLDFMPAALLTLELAAGAILLGLFLGLLVALARLSGSRLLSGMSLGYISLIRGTPLLLQVLVLYYGVTNIVTLSPFLAGTAAFGVHNGAYIAEIFRGAIVGIDRGQTEAAHSLGMPPLLTLRRVVLPQAFKRAVPPLVNQFIIATKDSSLASVITIRELVLQARQYGSANYALMEFLIIAGIYYLLMTGTLSWLGQLLETRLRVNER